MKNFQFYSSMLKGLSFALTLFGFSYCAIAQTEQNKKTQPNIEIQSKVETAIFSAGCFWCAEEIFSHLEGVTNVASGYTGGKLVNPTYTQVSSENTGHQEAVMVTYDAAKIDYNKLLDAYWHNIDPFDSKGQFCDKGDSYKAKIFYNSPLQKSKAESSKLRYETILNAAIVTEITPASTFYPAEEYHQHYATKNPIRYKYYRHGCGRDARLEAIWENKL